MSRFGANESLFGSVLRAAPFLIAATIFAAYHALQSGNETALGASNNSSLHPSQNRTLGFADILVAVVPSSTAEHFHHQLNTLSSASHYSGIDFRTFEGGGDKKYTKVWRGHMTMLRYVLEHNLETALILEGAVDWDIRIKNQLELLSSHLPEATTDRPYGVNWISFWLGSCGTPAEDNPEPYIVFQDESVVNVETQQAAVPSLGNQRAVNVVKRSGCTVAYAVTQAGAKRLLDEIGFEHVNLALDREDAKSYSIPGLILTPALFGEWDADATDSSVSLKYHLDQSIRKALYDHDQARP